MSTPFDALVARLDRLERANRDLASALRRRRWAGMAAILGAVALAVSGPATPGPRAAQPGPSAPLPPAAEPIRLGIGTRIIESEQFLLRDPAGNLLAVLATNQGGTSTLSLHAKNQSVRLILGINSDGEPGLIFFDRDGRRPVELVVSRDGEPSLKVVDLKDRPLFAPLR